MWYEREEQRHREKKLLSSMNRGGMMGTGGVKHFNITSSVSSGNSIGNSVTSNLSSSVVFSAAAAGDLKYSSYDNVCNSGSVNNMYASRPLQAPSRDGVASMSATGTELSQGQVQQQSALHPHQRHQAGMGQGANSNSSSFYTAPRGTRASNGSVNFGFTTVGSEFDTINMNKR